MDSLAATHATRKSELGPRPGKKSCVGCPQLSTYAASSSVAPATHDDLEYADDPDSPLFIPIPDSDDEELERDEVVAFGRPVRLFGGKFIDLDDDDGDVWPCNA